MQKGNLRPRELIRVRCISVPTFDGDKFTVGKTYDAVVSRCGERVEVLKTDTGNEYNIGMFGSNYICSFELVEGDDVVDLSHEAAYDRAMGIL